jgi:putative ABC transport system ATP-binding protein
METKVIKLRNLSKIYLTGDVEVCAVNGVSLDIGRGEFVAIMGASGSGKSTLMNLLGCLDQPTAGRFLLDGTDVSRLGRAKLSLLRNEKVGFVFQNFNLLSRTTARENVELPLYYASPVVGARRRKQRAIEALEKVGLADRLDYRPNQLSGGQQQRIAIARALVNHPEILLADEPTGNLDTRTSIEIMGIFQELNDSGITILMVTHELDIAAYSRRIVVMRDGRVISDKPTADRRFAQEQRAALDASEQLAKIGRVS